MVNLHEELLVDCVLRLTLEVNAHIIYCLLEGHQQRLAIYFQEGLAREPSHLLELVLYLLSAQMRLAFQLVKLLVSILFRVILHLDSILEIADLHALISINLKCIRPDASVEHIAFVQVVNDA